MDFIGILFILQYRDCKISKIICKNINIDGKINRLKLLQVLISPFNNSHFYGKKAPNNLCNSKKSSTFVSS